MLKLLWQEIEMEDAMHWLSTMGGAYSNLGEHSSSFVSEIVKFLLIFAFNSDSKNFTIS